MIANPPQVSVRNANLGVYLDRPPSQLPARAMSNCRNVRVKNGDVRNENCGWTLFMSPILNGTVTLIKSFTRRNGSQFLVFGTPTDLYEYQTSGGTVLYLTPREEAGTITATNGSAAVVGVGTTFTNLSPGDQIYVGAIGQRDPTAGWVNVLSITDNLNLTLTANWTAATAAGVAWTGRMRFAGDRLVPWRAAVFHDAPGGVDLLFLTNGYDVPMKWDGTATQVTMLPALGFTCREVRRYKNMMLYGDLVIGGTRFPTNVRGSAISDPENVTTLEAAEFNVSDAADTLMQISQIGDLLIVYCNRSVQTAQFVGPPLNWIMRTAIPEHGILSSRSVVEFPSYHQVASRDAVYRFDGVNADQVGSQVFREVLRRLDVSRVAQLIAYVDEENGENLWVIPQNSDSSPATKGPMTVYTEHYLERVSAQTPTPIAIRDLPATAIGSFERQSTVRFSDLPEPFSSYSFRFDDRFFQAAFPLTLFGTWDGRVYVLSSSDSQAGAAFTAFARMARFPAGRQGRKAAMTRFSPIARRRASADYSLGVWIYKSDQEDGDATLAATASYDITQAGERFVNPRVSGRFFEPLYITVDANQPWAVSGYDADLRQLGMR